MTDEVKISEQISNLIRSFDKLDEDLSKIGYFDDNDLREDFKYSIKTLYRLDSLIHLYKTKNQEVLRTPDYIKEGLNNLSK